MRPLIFVFFTFLGMLPSYSFALSCKATIGTYTSGNSPGAIPNNFKSKSFEIEFDEGRSRSTFDFEEYRVSVRRWNTEFMNRPVTRLGISLSKLNQKLCKAGLPCEDSLGSGAVGRDDYLLLYYAPPQGGDTLEVECVDN